MSHSIKQYPTWMNDIYSSIKKIPLTNLVIPGTHDSGTYGITTDSGFSPDFPYEVDGIIDRVLQEIRKIVGEDVWEMIKKCLEDLKKFIENLIKTEFFVPLAKAQPSAATFYNQLMGGIRYFDLRVAAREKCLYIVHSLYSIPLDDLLEQVHEFASTPGHEKEVIILDFRGLTKWDKEINKVFIEKIGMLKNLLCEPFEKSLSTVTVKEIVNRIRAGASIICIYDDTLLYEDKGPIGVKLWYNKKIKNIKEIDEDAYKYIDSYWKSDNDTTDKLRNFLDEKMEWRMKYSELANTFYVAQGIFTPSTDYVKKIIIYDIIKNFTDTQIRSILKDIITNGSLPNVTSLEDSANKLNDFVMNTWMKQFAAKYKQVLNIVIVNYFSIGDYLDVVVEINKS